MIELTTQAWGLLIVVGAVMFAIGHYGRGTK